MSITTPSAESTGFIARPAQSVVPGTFWAKLKISLRGHIIFLSIAVVFFLSAKIMTSTMVLETTTPSRSIIWMFLTATLPIIIVSVLTNRFIYLALYVKPKHPIHALAIELKNFFLNADRMAHGIPMVIAIVLTIAAYVDVKVAIPYLNAYSWDQYFDELDRGLHFGWHPWQLLQPVLGWPIVTFVINVLYNLWFMIMWMFWSWLAFSKSYSHIRSQFFLSYMLCWIIGGSILAIAFSSAGPCYYSNLSLSPDPYIPLMTYLHETNEIIPIWALNAQQLLWDGYLDNQNIKGGISAMPSMHNATAVLFALVGWRTNRWLGWALTVYAAIVLVGSVHLGWHYAVDGYFSIVMALLIWWFAGKVVSKSGHLSWIGNYRQIFSNPSLKERDRITQRETS